MNSASATKPKPRVLHLIASDGLYGAERVVLNLSLKMAQDDSFVPVIGVIVNHLHEDVELATVAVASGIEVLKLPIRNSSFIFDLWNLRRDLQHQHAIEVIHSHGYKAACYAYLLSKMAAFAIIGTCHLWYLDTASPLRMRAMIWVEKRLYKRFDWVVVVSEDLRQIVLEHGVRNDRVSIVPNGIPLTPNAQIAPDRERAREFLGLPRNSKLLLNVGRLTHQKAQDVLINALPKVLRSCPEAYLVIVGDGERKGELENLIDKLRLRSSVLMLGFRSDVHHFYLASDIFVLPSRDEGMPMSLLEAVAAHLPVIATDVGDVNRIIKDCSSGRIVPIDDVPALTNGLVQLLTDPQSAARYADVAYKKLKARYSSEAMYRDYRAIYDQLLASAIT